MYLTKGKEATNQKGKAMSKKFNSSEALEAMAYAIENGRVISARISKFA